MVLASILKERYREEGRKEGLAKGIARGQQEAHAEWEAWYERRQEAARAGVSFDEPPPTRKGQRSWDADQDAPQQVEPPCR